jgi:hypothetical protein
VGNVKGKRGETEAKMMINLALSLIMAIAVVIMGFYSMAFSRSAANWILSLDRGLARTDIHEKVYRAGFTAVGASFIMFGILTVFLVV